MNLKITSLKIHNLGLIEDTNVTLDKPLLIFYGDIMQGKTTILNGVRWCFGGSFPDDIIRHGEKEAFVELGFDGGCIRREWYVAKDKSTKARDVVFVRDGKPQKNPASEIKKFLNPFLLDQDHFRGMNEPDRKRYLVELFAVDTKKEDVELFNNEREASTLRATIKGYGAIDLKPVEPVDATALRAERQKIVGDHALKVSGWQAELKAVEDKHQEEVQAVTTKNLAIGHDNFEHDKAAATVASNGKRIEELQAELNKLKDVVAIGQQWLTNHPKHELLPPPPAPDTAELRKAIMTTPDTTELDAKISDAAANQVRHENYLAAKKRADQKEKDETDLAALEKRGREIKAEKVKKLAAVSKSSGVAGLEFDESGDFTYEGTSAGMLSTSQVMKLSEALSAKYPSGFGLSLLDRGESLGKSIFSLIERAQAEDKTILATVVGESLAKSPPEVGVFIVEKGNVKAQVKTEEPKLL